MDVLAGLSAGLWGLHLADLAWILSVASASLLLLATLAFKKPQGETAAHLSSTTAAFLSTRFKVSSSQRASSCDVKGSGHENVGDQLRQPGDSVDAIIVGAGVAGSALAYTLGKQGRRVLLLERDVSEPDRIVGELLQPGGFLKLVELGLEDCVEDIEAQKIRGYALFKDGRDAVVTYPIDATKYGADVDVAGRSFHNGRFVQKLRLRASSLPSVKLQQATVARLIEEGEGAVKGVVFRGPNGEDVEAKAPLTFVCDGCFSKLRRGLSKSKVENPSCFVGLVLKDCHLPHANHGHVILADPSPILFYPISDTEIRCLVDIPGTKVPSIGNGDMANYLNSVVCSQLPPQLQEPFRAAVAAGHIRTMPNKIMPADPSHRPGALLMGDAFNMRHPLTGGGMTVALSDVALVKEMLEPVEDFNDTAAICKYTQAFYTRRKPVAATINTLAGALYQVFCASPDIAMKEMREACFNYLTLGGACSSGPVALLSGLNPRPLSLVMHFFAVAFYALGRLLLPLPTPRNVWIGARLIKGACAIILPIIYAEGIRKVFFPTTVPSYYNVPPPRRPSQESLTRSEERDDKDRVAVI